MIPSTNYHPDRDGERVDGTIVHWTTGTLASAIAHFQDPSSRVSAHYLIDRDGTVVPVVEESAAAYHAGDWMTNLRTFGIEHVGGPGYDFTDAQYAASARLHRDLSARYGFPLDAQHIRPHRAIVATQCPGTLDVDRIVREASEEVEVTDAEFIEKYQRLVAPAVEQRVATVQKDMADLARKYGVHGHTTSGPTP